MKKIFISLLVFGSLFLFGSCKKGSAIINDAPREDIYETLNLSAVEQGKKLVGDTTAPYYDIKISNNINDTLFYQTINFTDFIENNHTIDLTPIAFNESFANSANPTLVEFTNILNNEKYGMNKTALGLSFVEDSNSGYLFGKFSTKNSINIPEGYDVNGNDNQLVVVYLPIYGIYFNSGENFQNVFLMLPIYYSFTHSENISSIVGNVKNFQCDSSVLVEINRGVWVLPSKQKSE